MLRLGEKNGFRNAQASVIAPTGTIGLAMSCDTTGLEPDLALVKFKKLVGGGSMQIVNGTVPQALRRLGYQEEQIEAIVAHIAEHGNVIDAPGLKHEHYEVFDCAMGERSISAMGHVRMMAAIQPWISGALSKTVNLPETATVEDVEEVYFEAWKMGVKALAIYRDNCKVGQPLSAKTKEKEKAEVTAKAEETIRTAVEKVVEYRPVRKRLPKGRPGITTSFTVGGAEGYMTANSYPDDGLGEVFLKMSKQGSTLAGMMDAFSIAVSVGLQYGVPLETYVSKFTNMRFEPAGMTDDPDVRMAQSIVDYIFRRLALDFLPFETRSALGIHSADERQRHLETGSYEPSDDERGRRGSRPVRAPRAGTEGRRHTEGSGRGGQARPAAGPHQRRTGGDAAGHPGGRPAVLLLRHEDAAGRLLLHLRGLRLDQRLQLIRTAQLRPRRPVRGGTATGPYRPFARALGAPVRNRCGAAHDPGEGRRVGVEAADARLEGPLSGVVAYELRDRRRRRPQDAAEVVLGQDGVALADAQGRVEHADERRVAVRAVG